MNGNSYFVFSRYIDDGHCKGNFASAERISRSDNLIAAFERFPNLKSVNACATFKEAREIAECWNECYKKNGTYAFAH